MSNRSDQLKEQVQAMRAAWQHTVEHAPANALVSLDASNGDALPFIDVASRLITATAKKYEVPIVYAVHIDNWFGERWLGFCGKICGAAGVRNRTLKKSLTLPPFHPNRVLKATGHYLRDDGLYAEAEELRSLHTHRPSETNIHNAIRSNTRHAWYSGNSVATHKGVVMAYLATESVTKAWYVTFNGELDWRLDHHVGITRREVSDLIETVSKRTAT
jgi:hypothetical protein